MKKQKGYILQKAKNFVCIAVMQSTNIKTGGPKTDENMVQLYILYPHMKPVEASKKGLDAHVCGDCKHRHHLGGACYVNLGHGPRATYDAYKNGVYYDAPDSVEQFLKVVERDKRAVRFGAYGDPAFISQDLVKKISAVASKVTGYTHQWKKRAVDKSLMLSVDNLQEKKEANAKGFRTFRVTFNAARIPGTSSDLWLSPHCSYPVMPINMIGRCLNVLICSAARVTKNGATV